MPLQPKVNLSVYSPSGINFMVSLTATVPRIFVFFFFYDIAYTPLLIAYTLEILPFKIRAKVR